MGPQPWGKEERLRQGQERKQPMGVGEKYAKKTIRDQEGQPPKQVLKPWVEAVRRANCREQLTALGQTPASSLWPPQSPRGREASHCREPTAQAQTWQEATVPRAPAQIARAGAPRSRGSHVVITVGAQK